MSGTVSRNYQERRIGSTCKIHGNKSEENLYKEGTISETSSIRLLTSFEADMAISTKVCSHLENLQIIRSDVYQCDECVALGDTWVHLRICQTCGGVHCCDSSKNKHATRHFLRSGHPVVISAEPGESWAWCYQDNTFTNY